MFRELLASEFAPYGRLTTEQLAQLEAHYELLTKWNHIINLTRINNIEDVVRLHYCESLFVGTVIPQGTLRIVDVGSGAGFPGIPIAIIRPECHVSLAESHQRKAVFLREASRDLPNINIFSCRAAEVKEKFDWLVSRAVAPLEIRSLHLAANTALLLAGSDMRGIDSNAMKLPWGENRFLEVFHVEHRA